ncbi:MAG: hypothetical protein ACQ5SW_00105 [Sphaerochaetaceae bacterium]
MHELISRYIGETVRHLKAKEREEVEKELEANILDMLGEDPSEEAIEQTLLDMGSPSSLATKYRGSERYLIGPATYDTYWMVLKLVALVVSLVTLVFTILSFLFTANILTIYEMIAKVLGSVFSAASSAFLWVTITFALLDRYQVKTDTKEWNRAELYHLVQLSTKEIKKKDSIIDLVGLSLFFLFLGFLYMKSNLLAIYQRGQVSIPLFQAELLRPYLLGWMGITVLDFFVAMLKLLRGRWTKSLLGFSAISDLIGVLYFIFVATRWQIYNNNALLFFNLSLERWQIIMKAASVILLILTLINIADDAYTTLKKTEPNEFGKAPVQ